MNPYKDKTLRCAGTHPRAMRTNYCPYNTNPEPERLAPLLPPSDAPPIPEDFWLIHRYRKGGVR